MRVLLVNACGETEQGTAHFNQFKQTVANLLKEFQKKAICYLDLSIKQINEIENLLDEPTTRFNQPNAKRRLASYNYVIIASNSTQYLPWSQKFEPINALIRMCLRANIPLYAEGASALALVAAASFGPEELRIFNNPISQQGSLAHLASLPMNQRVHLESIDYFLHAGTGDLYQRKELSGYWVSSKSLGIYHEHNELNHRAELLNGYSSYVKSRYLKAKKLNSSTVKHWSSEKKDAGRSKPTNFGSRRCATPVVVAPSRSNRLIANVHDSTHPLFNEKLFKFKFDRNNNNMIEPLPENGCFAVSLTIPRGWRISTQLNRHFRFLLTAESQTTGTLAVSYGEQQQQQVGVLFQADRKIPHSNYLLINFIRHHTEKLLLLLKHDDEMSTTTPGTEPETPWTLNHIHTTTTSTYRSFLTPPTSQCSPAKYVFFPEWHGAAIEKSHREQMRLALEPRSARSPIPQLNTLVFDFSKEITQHAIRTQREFTKPIHALTTKNPPIKNTTQQKALSSIETTTMISPQSARDHNNNKAIITTRYISRRSVNTPESRLRLLTSFNNAPILPLSLSARPKINTHRKNNNTHRNNNPPIMHYQNRPIRKTPATTPRPRRLAESEASDRDQVLNLLNWETKYINT